MMFKIKSLKLALSRRTPPPTPHSIWTNPIHYLACGCGLGCLPIMPGTFGTLAGIVVYLMLVPLTLTQMLLAIVALNVLGVWLCGTTNRDLGFNDHPAACFDEIAAFPICLIGISPTLPHILLAFVLFRILDILKPPPINWIDQHVHGGIGVMLDDIVAAIVTLAIMSAVTLLT